MSTTSPDSVLNPVVDTFSGPVFTDVACGRNSPARRASSLPVAELATVDCLHQRLRAYRSEIARLRLENQALREQLARRLGRQHAAANSSPR